MDDEARAEIKRLEAELFAVSEKLGRIYRDERDPILARLAELRPPAELPKPRYRTDKQNLVARCPRCRGRLTDATERYRAALKHIADNYDAETSATVPADPDRVGLEGPHEWVELSAYIAGVISPTEEE